MTASNAPERDVPPAVFVDVDGTLCDVRTIRHFVVAPSANEHFRRDFHAFHSASLDCPAHPEVTGLLERFRGAECRIIVVSAREARWGFLTAIWLTEHNIEYDEMILRPNGDSRSDAEVKVEMAGQLVERFLPVVAIEDRDDIIEVWQAFGIPTVKVFDDGALAPAAFPPGTRPTKHHAHLSGGTT